MRCNINKFNCFLKENSLYDWLNYIEIICSKNKSYNLNNIYIIAKKLNIFPLSSYIFTVTGTNGKGSTCFILEEFLFLSGYNVGLYTSPHIINYKERIRINKNLVDDSVHIKAFKNIELVRKGIKLTYFDFITLAALIIFKNYKLDVIILEVGIGGRLDSTNIIDADIGIITNIQLDHIHILGKKKKDIAYEKSGIFKKNKICLIGEYNIPKIIFIMAKLKSVFLKKKYYDWFWIKNFQNNTFNIHTGKRIFKNIYISYNILIQNLTLALVALDCSPFYIHKNIIYKYSKLIQIPGRRNIISYNPMIILDVAHNYNAAKILAKFLKKILFKNKNIKNIYVLFGILKDKNIFLTIKPLLKIVHYWNFSVLKTSRTMKYTFLKRKLPLNSFYFNNVHEAWLNIKKNITKNDIILIYGSFYVISEIIIILNNQEKNNYNIII